MMKKGDKSAANSSGKDAIAARRPLKCLAATQRGLLQGRLHALLRSRQDGRVSQQRIVEEMKRGTAQAVPHFIQHNYAEPTRQW